MTAPSVRSVLLSGMLALVVGQGQEARADVAVPSRPAPAAGPIVFFNASGTGWLVPSMCLVGGAWLDDSNRCLAVIPTGAVIIGKAGYRLRVVARQRGVTERVGRFAIPWPAHVRVVAAARRGSLPPAPSSEVLVWPAPALSRLSVPIAQPVIEPDAMQSARFLAAIQQQAPLTTTLTFRGSMLIADLDGDGETERLYKVDARPDGLEQSVSHFTGHLPRPYWIVAERRDGRVLAQNTFVPVAGLFDVGVGDKVLFFGGNGA